MFAQHKKFPMVRHMSSNVPKRVVVGMSGGVDSSVAAALLKNQGYEPIGITMKVWPQDCLSRAEDKCCGPQAVADARAVAARLGIPHYVVDEAADFEKVVIDYFASEYRAGRTPNPCVMCNEKLKFGSLLDRARRLGADYVATGHYARLEHGADGVSRLYRAEDFGKDQTYFLFSLRQEQLRHMLLPLGALKKTEVRAIARDLGLKTYDKEDSQEICFVPGQDYKTFLRKHGAGQTGAFVPGRIRDLHGRDLGAHEGLENYTIGQRKGLPGGSQVPLYVVDLDPETHTVYVGPAEALMSDSCTISNTNWHPQLDGQRDFSAWVRIRYQHAGCDAKITRLDERTARVDFSEPQRAVTPGQALVAYTTDGMVLGGGWIQRAVRTDNGTESSNRTTNSAWMSTPVEASV